MFGIRLAPFGWKSSAGCENMGNSLDISFVAVDHTLASHGTPSQVLPLWYCSILATHFRTWPARCVRVGKFEFQKQSGARAGRIKGGGAASATMAWF